MQSSRVFVVGAALGDPDLLTRKAERVLRTADAVIHDRMVSAQILCLANPDAEVVAVEGKSQEERQAEVSGWYLRLGDHSQSIVRLLVTDPVMGAEASEEYEFLVRHGFTLEILPSVLAETIYECRAAEREASAGKEPHLAQASHLRREQ